jgi:hypothetical protein
VVIGASRVELRWSHSQDKAVAWSYEIYRNGVKIGIAATPSFNDAAVRPATTYAYTVAERDAAGSVSRQSRAATVTTPDATATVKPTASSSPMPGAPSSFPGATNTGYRNSPGYPGHLTNCGDIKIQSDRTYKYCNFSDGISVGDSRHHPFNVTFIGCRFAANYADIANVWDYGDRIVFDYDTFEPNTVPVASEPIDPDARPIAHDSSYQFAILKPDAGTLSVDHSDIWGFANGIQFGSSSQSQPVNISNSWIHNPRDPGGTSGGDHTDGIQDWSGGTSYMVFNHNTIVGDGTTNALALQGKVKYDHVTITNNFFSGYGYMVMSGSDMLDTNMTFTGNIWGTELKPTWGPLYGDVMYATSGLHSIWADNRIYVQPGTAWMAKDNSGLYWWPSDSNPSNARQVVGHKSDYGGPR